MVRLNRKAYDRRRFADHGLAHYDLYFPDGRLVYSTSRSTFVLTNIGIYSLIVNSNKNCNLEGIDMTSFVCIQKVHTLQSLRKLQYANWLPAYACLAQVICF